MRDWERGNGVGWRDGSHGRRFNEGTARRGTELYCIVLYLLVMTGPEYWSPRAVLWVGTEGRHSCRLKSSYRGGLEGRQDRKRQISDTCKKSLMRLRRSGRGKVRIRG